MKKIFFALLIATVSLQAQPENAIVAINNGPYITVFDLSLSDHTFIAGWTTAAYVVSLLLAKGVCLLTGIAHIEEKLYPHTGRVYAEYTTSPLGTQLERAMTTALTAYEAFSLYKAHLPHNSFSDDQKKLIDTVIDSPSQEVLLERLDQLFLKEKFSRVAAFVALSELVEKLVSVRTLMNRVNPQRFALISATIDVNITALNQALYVIKAQPTWHADSNGYNLEYADKKFRTL